MSNSFNNADLSVRGHERCWHDHQARPLEARPDADVRTHRCRCRQPDQRIPAAVERAVPAGQHRAAADLPGPHGLGDEADEGAGSAGRHGRRRQGRNTGGHHRQHRALPERAQHVHHHPEPARLSFRRRLGSELALLRRFVTGDCLPKLQAGSGLASAQPQPLRCLQSLGREVETEG